MLAALIIIKNKLTYEVTPKKKFATNLLIFLMQIFKI